MPAQVVTAPLAVRFVFSDGACFEARLDHFPCQKLVADLAYALARMGHPHGGVNSRSTVEHYRTSIGLLSRFLHDRGFRGGAAALTRSLLLEFWMSTSRSWENMTRMLLRSWDTSEAALASEIRAHLAGEPIKAKPRRRKRPYAPYSETEWARLRACCERIVVDGLGDHRAGLVGAARGSDPAIGDWTPDNALWLLHRYGPLTDKEVRAHTGWH